MPGGNPQLDLTTMLSSFLVLLQQGGAGGVLVAGGAGQLPVYSTTPSLSTVATDDGSTNFPSQTFSNESNTGWYRIGLNDIGFAIGGVKRIEYLTSGFRVFNGTNLEYGTITWASNQLTIGGVNNGGSARNLVVAAGNNVSIAPNNGIAGYTFAPSGVTLFAALTTVQRGVPCIVGYGRATAQAAANASVATFTVGAADGSFEVSANVLVTTATTHTFNVECAYTDEGNTARTVIMAFRLVGDTTAVTNSVVNTNGTVPYNGIMQAIRAKAATAITIRTQAAGTYTTVAYNIEGLIKQLV